ncbi:DDE-type integrase/transposase/recombinase [Faucicola atlantae]|uniref:DDE-type integrase/transposase/recombinase n=1 Tax=Faucicola atlantae TaxID=34059 RepID=UPI0009F4BA62|nr:DDE-type integrase/transposase/recombinase [Moraxella atlantae]
MQQVLFYLLSKNCFSWGFYRNKNSDQGMHYTSRAFADTIAQCKDMKHSMSRKANCWDNALTERFFRSFKTKWMLLIGYDDLACARIDVASPICLIISSSTSNDHHSS